MSSVTRPGPADELRAGLTRAMAQVNDIIVGKGAVIEQAFACLLAGGHLLIEDIPGVGKTTLAQAIAISMGADYHRVQFTSDLLPADILGVSVYRRDREAFEFHPGPIFSQLVLADEVNRATPKTQSALLEAMAEGQVSVEGETRELPTPFFVIATQNPLDSSGTFNLPDSQLDRFLLSISLGYPDQDSERRLLAETDRQLLLENLGAALQPHQVVALQEQARGIHVSDALLDYVQALLAASRTHPDLKTGLSPRAGLALLRACRALALIHGRDFVLPEDVQALFVPLARHRLQPRESQARSLTDLVEDILASVAIP